MLRARSSPTVEYLPIPFQSLFTDTVKKAALNYHASRWGVNAAVLACERRQIVGKYDAQLISRSKVPCSRQC